MGKKSISLQMILLFSLCFQQALFAAEKPIGLEFSSVFQSTAPVFKTLAEMGDVIGERSAGRVKITIYPEGTLTSVPQTYDAVVKGIADIGHGAFVFNRGRFPLMEVLDLPLGLKSSTEATKLGNAFLKKFQPKELNDVKVLLIMGQPPAMLQTSKPVRSFTDLRGLKTRVGGGTVADIVSALGAVPVAMSMGDSYDAMRKGIIQAVMSAYEPLENRNLADVVKYSVENYSTANGVTGFVVMNKAKWNSLPPDIQTIIQKTADEYTEKVSRAWDDQEQHAKQYAMKKGVEIVRLPAAEQAKALSAIGPLYDKYVKDKTAMGLPAKEALAFCQEYVKNLHAQASGARQ
ncbi:MAG: TRAP transporter substrate-binding protein [Deltaproteobacteria bacterium]|nr:TRAP transporter substrate-binding protein [Deltaproteobacteria bacterium]